VSIGSPEQEKRDHTHICGAGNEKTYRNIKSTNLKIPFRRKNTIRENLRNIKQNTDMYNSSGIY
jgi:hypothetical protein